MDDFTNNTPKQDDNKVKTDIDVEKINEYIHKMKLEIDLLKKLMNHIDSKMLS